MKKLKSKIWQRKKNARSNPTNELPDISLDKLSTHRSTYFQTPPLQRLAKTTTTAIEQQIDIILQHLRLKLQKEGYSETILQQDPQYRQYCRQLDRLSVQDDVIIRDYYDETGSVQNHHALLPKHLVTELLQSLQTNIREFLKSFMKSVKSITIQDLPKSSEDGSKGVK